MLFNYIFAISFTFSFSIVGLLINNAIKDKPFYNNLSYLNFIESETVNRYLGVIFLKKVLATTFLGGLNQTIKIKERPNPAKLLTLRQEMTSAEIGHLIAFVCVLITVVIFRMKYLYTQAIIPILVFNVVFHIYPPLVQQYNKRRLDKVLTRIAT